MSEIDEILEDGNYSWIKVKRYKEDTPNNPDPNKGPIDWQDAYGILHDHHEKETSFLIDKCKELARSVKGEEKKETIMKKLELLAMILFGVVIGYLLVISFIMLHLNLNLWK